MKFILVASVLVHCWLSGSNPSAYESDCSEVVLNVPGFGKVKGRHEKSVDNKDYATYSEINYAHVAENGWFQPAIPVTTESEGIVNESPFLTCPKWDYFSRYENLGDGVEPGRDNQDFDDTRFRNCLLLKVDTNDVTAKNPVIVFLSGIDLESGHIHTVYGTYLMKKDVVLVSVQYRGEAFGYLSTQSPEIPGNIAISDTIEALRWVQKYISYFGGDPNRITLNGHYLAAGIIGALTASPYAEGLFHQVIYQSGSLEFDKFKTNNPVAIATEVAYELGCTYVDEIARLNRCFLRASRQAVLKAYDTVSKRNGGAMYPITLGGPSGLIEENYQVRQYPTIGGFVDHPAVYLLEKNRPKSNYSRFSKMFLEDFYKEDLDMLIHSLNTRIGERSKLLAEFYGKNTLDEKLDVRKQLLNRLIEAFVPVEIDMAGLDIKLSVLKTLLKNKELGGNSYLFIYRFKDFSNYLLSGSIGRTSILKNYVTLSDDLPPIYTDRSFPGAQMDLVDFMIELWSSFAATGKPNSSIYWPELASIIGPYLVIDKNVNVQLNLLNELTPTIDCRKTRGCQWAQL